MGRTSLNVTGDLAATCIVAKSEGQLDSSYWENTTAPESALTSVAAEK